MQESTRKEDARQSVVLLGTGHMARGIADLTSVSGFKTTVVGRSEASVEMAREALEAERALAVGRKRIDQAVAEEAASRLHFTTDPQVIGAGSVVIETIVEDLSAKQVLFETIRPHLADDALVATNTSALRVSDLAGSVPKPERFIGFHFMNPPATVKLVEIVPGPATSDTTLECAKAFAKQLGKQFVIAKDEAGFVVNRLLMLLINEAAKMIESGAATPSQIDKAMRLGCGHAMGPVSVADFIGLDTVRAELLELANAHGDHYAPAAILEEQFSQGNLGRKTGKGLLAVKGRGGTTLR